MSVEGGLSYACPICPDSDNFSGHDSYLDHYAKTHVSMEVASHPANKAASSAIVLLCQRTFGSFQKTATAATITMTTVPDFQLTSCLYCTHLAPNQRNMRRHIATAHPLRESRKPTVMKAGKGADTIVKRNLLSSGPSQQRRKGRVDENGNVFHPTMGLEQPPRRLVVGFKASFLSKAK